jgi:hypothetical protein
VDEVAVVQLGEEERGRPLDAPLLAAAGFSPEGAGTGTSSRMRGMLFSCSMSPKKLV